MTFTDMSELVGQLEGPYKWYVIGGVIIVLTAFLTRFVFKTIKWFLLLIFIGVLLFAALGYLFKAGM